MSFSPDTSSQDTSLPKTFNRLAWSNLVAQSAEQVALAAVPIVAVLLLGAGAGETGLLQTALTMPFVLFAIPAGLMADRMARRRLMAGAGGPVVKGGGGPGLFPCWGRRQALPAANARIELARTIASGAGPAVGGLLVGWIGAAPAFGFAAILSILAVVLLSGIHEPARAAVVAAVVRRRPLQEIKEGAAFVFGHDLLRPVFVTQFIFNTASF